MLSPVLQQPYDTPVSVPALPANPPVGGFVNGAPLNSGTVGTKWYVRTVGLNSNGGSSPGPNPERTVSDGVTNGTNVITSATIAFTQADVGKGLSIAGNRFHKIVGVTNSTTATIDRVTSLNASGQTFRIGGAWQDLRPVVGDSNVAGADVNSGVQAGDDVYVGAGVYRVSGYTCGSAWKPTGRVVIHGDITGVYTGDAGQVMLQPVFAESNGQVGMSTSVATFSWANPGAGWYMQFEDIFFGGSFNTLMFSFPAAPPQELVFRRCIFNGLDTGSGRIIRVTGGAGAARYKLLFDRCIFNAPTNASGTITLMHVLGTLQDWDLDVTVQNSLVTIGGASFLATANSGAGSGKPGGCKAINNTIMNNANTVLDPSGGSTSVPMKAFGNVLFGNVTNNAGQFEEDYNVILQPAATSRPTQGSGGHTLKGDTTNVMFVPLWSLGQEFMWNMKPRPIFEPVDGSITSPQYAWRIGTKTTEAGPVDIYGRPRPSSPTAWDVGCMQRWNTAKRSVVVVQNGANALQFTGFGGQDFDIPLDAGSYNFNVWMQYDSNYQGPLPTFEVLRNDAIGVGGYQLPISSAALNNWVQYTIQLITTVSGVATVRFSCRDVSLQQNGNLYVDNFSVT